MRVLLSLASSSLTGPAERMLGDAETLRAAGHAVAIACDTRTPGNLVEICRARGLPLAAELNLSRRSGPFESLADVVRLRRRLREIDLVHAHFSHDHHLALLAAAGLPTRVVRSLEAAETGSRLAFEVSAGFEVPYAELSGDRRLARFQAAGKVAVLPAAVDPSRFSPAPSSKLRATLGVPADAPLVGIVARIKAERLHRDLILAFRGVLAELPAARLVIVGRGEGQPALERLVADHGLGAQVKFAGYWAGDDLVEAYRGLDVAVWLAAGNDGGCRGVLEAMAVGLPVVAYGVPPMNAQLAGGAGVLVGAEDLAGTLVRLLRDSGARQKLGAAARARVLSRYTAAQRGAALLAFYARILQA